MKMNRIIVGDTLTELKKLPDGYFDVGVTSPPYNKGERHRGWLVDNVIYDQAGDGKDEEAYQAEQVAVLDELYRVTAPGGSFFYNHTESLILSPNGHLTSHNSPSILRIQSRDDRARHRKIFNPDTFYALIRKRQGFSLNNPIDRGGGKDGTQTQML